MTPQLHAEAEIELEPYDPAEDDMDENQNESVEDWAYWIITTLLGEGPQTKSELANIIESGDGRIIDFSPILKELEDQGLTHKRLTDHKWELSGGEWLRAHDEALLRRTANWFLNHEDYVLCDMNATDADHPFEFGMRLDPIEKSPKQVTDDLTQNYRSNWANNQ